MRSLRVVFANSKDSRAHPIVSADVMTVAPQAVACELRKWLDAAVKAASTSGACVTFSVSVHQFGADCDHEVPS